MKPEVCVEEVVVGARDAGLISFTKDYHGNRKMIKRNELHLYQCAYTFSG
jgi:hypothetical protein